MPRARPSRRGLWLLAGCLSIWTSSWTSSASARSAPAAATRAPLPAALNLPDKAFFADDVDPKLEARLLDSRFVGVALRVPRRVDVIARSTLPVLVASRFDGARDWDFPLLDLGWLVGVDLASGEVRIASAFGNGKRSAPEDRGERPSGDELTSYGAQLSLIDARSKLDLPWQPGCWAFSLIYYDWSSNSATSRLVSPQVGQGNQGNVDCSPLPSANTRLAFQVERGQDGRVRVSGRYSLPAGVLPVNAKTLSASLLLVTSDGAAPHRIDLPIPVEHRPGTRLLGGKLAYAFSPDGEPATGAVVYLVAVGQVYGPRPWPTKPAPSSASPR
jgi:hypothetical protein